MPKPNYLRTTDRSTIKPNHLRSTDQSTTKQNHLRTMDQSTAKPKNLHTTYLSTTKTNQLFICRRRINECCSFIFCSVLFNYILFYSIQFCSLIETGDFPALQWLRPWYFGPQKPKKKRQSRRLDAKWRTQNSLSEGPVQVHRKKPSPLSSTHLTMRGDNLLALNYISLL
jgi:hypothetical protein